MLGDEDGDTPAEQAYQKAMAAGESDRLYVPHEPTAEERANRLEAKRAGERLMAQIWDLLRKKVL